MVLVKPFKYGERAVAFFIVVQLPGFEKRRYRFQAHGFQLLQFAFFPGYRAFNTMKQVIIAGA
jgi:hypothetical protein